MSQMDPTASSSAHAESLSSGQQAATAMQQQSATRQTAAAVPKTGTVQHYATCSLDCPDSCRVIATEDLATGRLVKLQGDPAHPVTRGFLCGKVARFLDRVYAPDRVLTPMRRRSGVAKGSLPHGREHESFEPITWDEALAEIATRLQAISDTHGPESILPYSYAGTIGQLGYGSMDRRFFHRLGASQLDRTICASAGAAALTDVYGARLGMEPQSFAKAKFVIAWGANIHGNNIHLWPFIEEARRNGARLVVIDPYQTRTARLADEHLQIRPGTDVLLAMSMMHVIVDEHLHDQAYIDACTHGFPDLIERLREPQYAPEAAAAITGLTADQIVALARSYATSKPAAIRVNYGVQRSESGGTAVRAICMLPLLTGAWQHPGGGLLLSTSGAFGFNSAKLHMPELMHSSPLGREARTVNMSRLGHALTQLGVSSSQSANPDSHLPTPTDAGAAAQNEGPRVHALFVYNSNPAAVAPNQNAVLRGMRRPDLFTVVHDSFFTDTADYADIVLPAPTWLEQTDIQGAYGHLHVQLSPAAIAPLGEARTNVWLFAELAQRMGFTEPCFRDTERDLIAQALTTQHPWLHDVTLDRLEATLSQQENESSFRPERSGVEKPAFAIASAKHEPELPVPPHTNVISTGAKRSGETCISDAPPTSNRMQGHGFLALDVPRTKQGDFLPFSTPEWFRTPTGRGEFASEARRAAGLDPLPAYVPGEEGYGSNSPAYPLQLLPRKGDNWMNSTFANLPRHRAMQPVDEHTLEMHATDALPRGIQHGDEAEVRNERGSMRLTVHLSDRVRPGVVTCTLGWNKLAPGGHGVNTLTSERLTDMAVGATFYSTLVQVEAFVLQSDGTMSVDDAIAADERRGS